MEFEHDIGDMRGLKWASPKMLYLQVFLAALPGFSCLGLAAVFRTDWIGLAAVPTSFLVCWWMLRLRGQRWSDLGFRRPQHPARMVARAVLFTMLLIPAMAVAGALLESIFGISPDLSRFDLVRGNKTALVTGLAIVWTTAAFGEELVFRGFIMQSLYMGLRQSMHEVPAWAIAIAFTATAFGAGHLYQGLAGAILTGVIGTGLVAIFFLCNRNLWGSILTHGLYNTVGFVLIYSNWDQWV